MAVEIKPDQAYAYAELLEILSYTDVSLVNKIPKKMLTLFETHASKNYEKHIQLDVPLEEQNISRKTASLITLLSLHYWSESEKEKNEIKRILQENEKLKEQRLREKYNPDNIFNNNTIAMQENEITSNSLENESTMSNLPIDYNSLPWYKKVFTSFRNFLLKIFKKQNNPT